jgi:hypothetical protein
MMMMRVLILWIYLVSASLVDAWTNNAMPLSSRNQLLVHPRWTKLSSSSLFSSSALHKDEREVNEPNGVQAVSRGHFISWMGTVGVSLLSTTISSSSALASSIIDDNKIKLNLSDAEVREIVRNDLINRQFLVTGQLTPTIYAPEATFTDEIDTYTMTQWQQGTAKLFVGDQSSVRLVNNQINVSPAQIDFRFDEDLMFNIPFHPKVHLTGTVVLQRNNETGYITSYREYWDQDVWTVLQSAKI